MAAGADIHGDLLVASRTAIDRLGMPFATADIGVRDRMALPAPSFPDLHLDEPGCSIGDQAMCLGFLEGTS